MVKLLIEHGGDAHNRAQFCARRATALKGATARDGEKACVNGP